MKTLEQGIVAFCLLATICITGCQTSSAAAGTDTAATAANRRSAPQRVDLRGSITRSQYDQGQVMLEVEGFPSPDSRYNRGYVLVLPTTQIIGLDGKQISLSELRQGQNVAIFMKNGGQGNFVGLGVARKIWIEETF